MERPIYKEEEEDENLEIDEVENYNIKNKVIESMEYEWGYIDDEDTFEMLIESLNTKGVRERKLQENLRKIKDRLKMRKAKKSAT